ncbi:MAG: class I SAM-dependent methyltransferase [Variibacter sp.]
MAEVSVKFDAADDYERFMGGWSRVVGEKFLVWLDPPKGARWLDVGCGTGAFTELILKHCAPQSVSAVDPSPQQIAYARQKVAPATFHVGDALSLPFDDEQFDVVASALVFHFLPDRAKAFAEMKRVLRPGGVMAGYTWQRSEKIERAPYTPMMSGVQHVGGEAKGSPIVPEAMPDGLRASFDAAGYQAIATTSIEASKSFPDFADYWAAQTLPFSPPGQAVARLDEQQRARLRAHLLATLPTASDGSITYSACATAGKARRPA